MTGASKGIGRAIAEAFVVEGAAVAINARDPRGLEDAAATLKRLGGRVLCVVGDVSNEKDVIRIVDQAVHEFGRLDILVNNAGSECSGARRRMRRRSRECPRVSAAPSGLCRTDRGSAGTTSAERARADVLTGPAKVVRISDAEERPLCATR